MAFNASYTPRGLYFLSVSWETVLADIFISYSRSDRERVALLADALHSSGYSIWWDSDLAGGVEYSREIEARINAAKAVVVVWSRKSIESTWVADEAELGRDAGKLVPLVIDDIQPKIGFRQFQSIDFCNWTGDVGDSCFATLKQTLTRHIEPEPPATNIRDRTFPRRSRRQRSQSGR